MHVARYIARGIKIALPPEWAFMANGALHTYLQEAVAASSRLRVTSPPTLNGLLGQLALDRRPGRECEGGLGTTAACVIGSRLHTDALAGPFLTGPLCAGDAG